MKSGIKNLQHGLKGVLNTVLAKNIERVLAIPGSKLYRRYVKASRNAKAEQELVLREIIDYTADTAFGKEHGFSDIRTVEDFQNRLPINEYEYFRPYVDRHAKGEQNVLIPGKPLMYCHTSGTTALPKMVPVSTYNFERTIKNRGKLWLYGLSRNFPGLLSGKDFTVVSPSVDGYTDDGTPFGSLSGLIYQNIPDFVKLVHTVPYELVTIKSYDAKAYALLRFGVPSNVTTILTANPSTILNLVNKADLWKEELIRDVHDGTLKPSLDLEPSIRDNLEGRLEPAPEKARELDRIASSNDKFAPAEFWPNLRLVHTWTNGNCRLVIPKLKPWFKDETPILDFGYFATEVSATDLIDPQTNGSLLSLLNAFYEFRPLGDDDEASEEFLMAHQLEVGTKYNIYITTFNGLFRYDMNDVIEVVGHFNQAPILRFLYKGKGMTSLQGEKLSELQLIEAVKQASSSTDIATDFFIGYANPDRNLYELYIEFVGDYKTHTLSEFARAADAALSEVNLEYQAKRHTERLHPLEVIPLEKNAFFKYRAIRLQEGAQEGQFKWMHLSSSEQEQQRMKRLSSGPPPPI